ncbi:alanyl-tRNA synthetase [Asanoa hainanensis]|uniref:alanine--tRNA ligase n=1 Tax=Asanoa hainanensis TaxID=560556 RepID=A0A239K680_9ACTN|nr:alanine--tRNA ligase-related protein [Asanoa hainanensis]SNT13192.1 alanyl-tRNA synthetase [Asanoa hainanensis]
MRSEQIRSTFLDYFRGLDHLELPPGPLVPDERDLLFTNAGMVQFKPCFVGASRPPHPRLSTAQPCVRTVDIDKIGVTDRHATTFEMLGNFAFADYFKREAMAYALRLLTEGYGLERDRLWFTVLRGDEESVDLWRGLGVPAERIQPLGPDDNFWSMGVPGPSGPTSEIFYDRGPSIGRDGGPAVDSERFVELWNLVFMQYERGRSDDEILGDLPGRHIDTGLGRDRLAMVLQGVGNVHETDAVLPTLRAVREATGRDDEPSAHRLVADHVRTAVRLIATGVRPGNEGRGYVVRRLLRRAVRRLVLLGVDEPVLGAVADSVTEVPGGVAREVVEREERAFRRTLRAGNRLLDTELARGPLRGETVFKLHDTYGFPVDLTVEIARESGVAVDTDGFERLMREHRERSRAATR